MDKKDIEYIEALEIRIVKLENKKEIDPIMLFGMLKGYEDRLDALENAGANADEMNEVEPTKTLELTEEEIERLLYLVGLGIVIYELEHSRDIEMTDLDNNLLNKLNGK
jgi:hypothetical protein